jgi:hypothetical protein
VSSFPEPFPQDQFMMDELQVVFAPPEGRGADRSRLTCETGQAGELIERPPRRLPH